MSQIGWETITENQEEQIEDPALRGRLYFFRILIVLVLGGLHGDELADADGRAALETRIADRCAEAGLAPVAAIEQFIW